MSFSEPSVPKLRPLSHSLSTQKRIRSSASRTLRLSPVIQITINPIQLYPFQMRFFQWVNVLALCLAFLIIHHSSHAMHSTDFTADSNDNALLTALIDPSITSTEASLVIEPRPSNNTLSASSCLTLSSASSASSSSSSSSASSSSTAYQPLSITDSTKMHENLQNSSNSLLKSYARLQRLTEWLAIPRNRKQVLNYICLNSRKHPELLKLNPIDLEDNYPIDQQKILSTVLSLRMLLARFDLLLSLRLTNEYPKAITEMCSEINELLNPLSDALQIVSHLESSYSRIIGIVPSFNASYDYGSPAFLQRFSDLKNRCSILLKAEQPLEDEIKEALPIVQPLSPFAMEVYSGYYCLKTLIGELKELLQDIPITNCHIGHREIQADLYLELINQCFQQLQPQAIKERWIQRLKRQEKNKNKEKSQKEQKERAEAERRRQERRIRRRAIAQGEGAV